MNGNVKRLFPAKKSGYIVTDHASYFFLYSHFTGDGPMLGQPVSFAPSESRAGRLTAINIRPWRAPVPSVASGLSALTRNEDDDLMEQLTQIVETLSD